MSTTIQFTQVAHPKGDSPAFFTVDIENVLDRFKNFFLYIIYSLFKETQQ